MRVADFMRGLGKDCVKGQVHSGISATASESDTHSQQVESSCVESYGHKESSMDMRTSASSRGAEHEMHTSTQNPDNCASARDRMMQEKGYLFDWSLPSNVPELCEELRIPEYFSKDWLQCLPEGTLFRDAWPSLFVARKGTRSGLHVDTFGRCVLVELVRDHL
jgi:hypothetical protein